MNITPVHSLGIISIIMLVCILGIYSGIKVKSIKDYINPTGLTTGLVVGSIVGAMAGGSVIMGTAQSGFNEGFNAMWFTIGTATTCVVLCIFAPYIRKHSSVSLSIDERFGKKTGRYLSVLTVLSFEISVLSQMTSAASLFHLLLGISPYIGSVIAASVMLIVIVFGGMWASGIVGIVKTVLVCFVVISSGLIAYKSGGGFNGILSGIQDPGFRTIFPEGTVKGISSGIATCMGAFVTHTYVQAVLSAKSVWIVRRGMLIAAGLMIVLGFATSLVGIYTRVYAPMTIPAETIPSFVIKNFPAFISGIMLGTVFIAIVVSGSMLLLSMSTITVNSLIPESTLNRMNPKKRLYTGRLLVIMYIAVPLLLSILIEIDSILRLAYLAVYIRASILFIPYIISISINKTSRGSDLLVAVPVGIYTVITGMLRHNMGGEALILALALEAAVLLVFTLYRKHLKRGNY